MIKYGLISETDARTLEKTIDLIIKNDEPTPFGDPCINITEIGLFNCETAKGVVDYIHSLNTLRTINYTGIDNEKDKPIKRPAWMNLIIGNSNEVYNQIPDNSQHLIFEDSCHCFACVCSTFFCYAPKVKVGGYFAFHDTGRHIKPFKDFQHGDRENPDAYISVRKALNKIGLLTDYDEWELVFDEADETNEAGGVTVFRKLY